MQRHEDVVQNQIGTPIPGVTVTVRVQNATPGSGALATIYSDDGSTVISGSAVTTDTHGRFFFFAPDGKYDLTATGTGITTYTLADIEIADVTERFSSDSPWVIDTETVGKWNDILVVDGNKYPQTGEGIQAAHDDLSANGGTIFLPAGSYDLSSTLTLDKSVTLVGAGRSRDGTPVTVLTWSGSSGGTMLSINTGTSALHGGGLENFSVDATGLGAGIGILATSIESAYWKNIFAIDLPSGSTGIRLAADTTAGNADFNVFVNVGVGSSAGRPDIALHLQNASGANVTHNRFFGLRLAYNNANASNRGILDEGNDNNSFYSTFLFSPSGGSGMGVELKALNGQDCRSEFFFHIEPDKGFTVDATTRNNWVYGYDTENGQPLPTIAPGGELFIITNDVIGGGSPIGVSQLAIADSHANAQTAAGNIDSSESLLVENASGAHIALKHTSDAAVWRLNVDSSGEYRLTLAGAGQALSANNAREVDIPVGLSVPVTNALEGAASNTPRWIFKKVEFSDMTAASTADTFILWTLPANTMIHDVVGFVQTGWSGGFISAAVASVGTQSGADNDLALDDNFFNAATRYELHDATANGGKGALLFDATDKFAPYMFVAGGVIELQMDLTDDNHTNATAGQARIYILVSQPLSNTTIEAN